ncbi:MAG: nicotinamide riboside transporter PnuC [Flavobacteriaceae bacterium]|jgi:nicotinamide mononucleotide transporter|nr:nicotinamide riboside transporter PnuC [Flavobacteriaceae bacterium]
MDMLEEWFLIVREQYKQVSWLEGIGVCFGITEVLFAKCNKVWLYPCGLISISITAYLYFDVRLYAEILLQVYYFVMSVYGWVLWSKRKGTGLNVSYSTTREWMISIGIVIGSWNILYLFLHFTNSDVPVWDSLVSAFAWAGMWLLAKRKVENWIFLNISNLIAIPLLIHKGLFLYSLLTIFLFIIAVFGYFDWKRIIDFHRNKLIKIN